MQWRIVSLRPVLLHVKKRRRRAAGLSAEAWTVGAAGGTVGQQRGGQRAAADFPPEQGLPIQGARPAAIAQGTAQETAGRRGRGAGRQTAETRTEGAGPQPPRPTSTRQATRTNPGGGRHAARYRRRAGASRETGGQQSQPSRPRPTGWGAPRRGPRRGAGPQTDVKREALRLSPVPPLPLSLLSLGIVLIL